MRSSTAAVTLACQFCGKLNRLDLSRHTDRPKCGECGRPFLLDRPVKVSDDHFDATVLKAQVPVLVDFYADWCGPCKMMAPILDDIARDRAGELLVAKVDTDRSPVVSRRYGIRSIPFFCAVRGRQDGEDGGGGGWEGGIAGTDVMGDR